MNLLMKTLKPTFITPINSSITSSTTPPENTMSDSDIGKNDEHDIEYDIYKTKEELDPEFKKDDYLPYTYNIHDTMKQISNDLNNFNKK